MVELLFSTDDQPYSVRPISATNFVHYLANKPLDTKKSLFFDHRDPEVVKRLGNRKLDI